MRISSSPLPQTLRRTDPPKEPDSPPPSDRHDWSDPIEFVPVMGRHGFRMALGGMPVVGFLLSANDATDPALTKSERWVAVAGAASNFVGICALAMGPSTLALSSIAVSSLAYDWVHSGHPAK